MSKDWLKNCTFSDNNIQEELTLESLAEAKKLLEKIKFSPFELELLKHEALIYEYLAKNS